MKIKFLYAKKPNYMMTRKDAKFLFLEDLVTKYDKVFDGELDVEDQDDVFRIFNSDDENPLVPNQKPYPYSHTSMSVSDIVVIDNTLNVCLPSGWYSLK